MPDDLLGAAPLDAGLAAGFASAGVEPAGFASADFASAGFASEDEGAWPLAPGPGWPGVAGADSLAAAPSDPSLPDEEPL